MKIGILSDTHDEHLRTRNAVKLLKEKRAEVLIHCGDLTTPEIVEICSLLPFYFVFGNHDSDMVPYLEQAAFDFDATCLRWGGDLRIGGKHIAVVHGHLTSDLLPLLHNEPDYLFSGHSHIAESWMEGRTRRINPGALFRTDEYSVAILDLETEDLTFLQIE